MKHFKYLFIISIMLASVIFTPVKANEATTEAILQYNQGIEYYKIGQYESAINAFRAAIRLNPNYIDAYYNLGAVLEYLQQYDSALAIFKQIIVRKPDDYDAVYKAAWLSCKLGDNQRARSYLSIIPSNCSRGVDARNLASTINAQIGPAIETKPNATKSVGGSSTNLFQGIPAPTGITTDKEGNTYVAEFNNNCIIKIKPSGQKELYIKDPKIAGPIGLASDNFGNIYIANYNKDNVLKVTPFGQITVLISNVKKPYCLHVNGNAIYISCQGSNSVLKYKLK